MDSSVSYIVIVEKGRESGYVAYIPALKGCVSQGPTKKAALDNLKEAAEAYVEALREDRLPVPEEVDVETVELRVA